MTHRLIVLKYTYLRLEHEDIIRMTDHHLVCKEDGSPPILCHYPTSIEKTTFSNKTHSSKSFGRQNKRGQQTSSNGELLICKF